MKLRKIYYILSWYQSKFFTVICPWKEAVESIISKRHSVISTSIEYVHLTSILCTNYWQSAAGQTGNISILKQFISILT